MITSTADVLSNHAVNRSGPNRFIGPTLGVSIAEDDDKGEYVSLPGSPDYIVLGKVHFLLVMGLYKKCVIHIVSCLLGMVQFTFEWGKNLDYVIMSPYYYIVKVRVQFNLYKLKPRFYYV